MRPVQTQNRDWHEHRQQVHPKSASSFRFGLAMDDLLQQTQTQTQTQSRSQSQQPGIGINRGAMHRASFPPFLDDHHLSALSSGSGLSASVSVSTCRGTSHGNRDSQNCFGTKPLLRGSSEEGERERELEHELGGDQGNERSRSGSGSGSQQLHHHHAYPPPSLISRSTSIESIMSVSSSSTSAASAASHFSTTSFVANTQQPQQFVFTNDQDMDAHSISPHPCQQQRHTLFPLTPSIHASIAAELTKSSSSSGSTSASGPRTPSSTGGWYGSDGRPEAGTVSASSEHHQQNQGYTPLSPSVNGHDYSHLHLQSRSCLEGYRYGFDYQLERGTGVIPNDALDVGGEGIVGVSPGADASKTVGEALGGDNAGVEGSLDPTTGIYFRTSEHPRMRTLQACEKCRVRKAKVRIVLLVIFEEKTSLYFLPLLHLCRSLSAVSSLSYFILLAFFRSFSYPSDTSINAVHRRTPHLRPLSSQRHQVRVRGRGTNERRKEVEGQRRLIPVFEFELVRREIGVEGGVRSLNF
jgi:hypothetical protein